MNSAAAGKLAPNMDATLVRFGALLRMRGIRISPPEMIDAARALARIDLARRDLVKVALQTTLVKDERDVELFEAFFTVASLTPDADEDDATGSTTPAGADAQRADATSDVDAELGPDSEKERTELGQLTRMSRPGRRRVQPR